MAYVRELHVPTCRHCGKRATHEVINARNASHGHYCQRHAKAEVTRICQLEDQEYPPR
jgi:hypothetical protein